WTRISSKTPRSLESIVLCEEKKRKLLDDIGAFLEPSKRKWYADRGIPWRRGYLFHGPPGTGKTSLALAVAAHYNLPVYIIPLSDRNITDSSIGLFLRSLPSPGLLLMEDIDTAGLVSGVGRQCDGDIKQDGETNGRLTRTGFINALDGPGTPEGILFMMTTNHRENLSDPAMVRPGRIDVELELPLATQDDARQMFINLYRDFARIEELADEFKDKIPHNKYSSAEIQNFLIICKHPQNALQRLSAWLEEGKRVQDRES
ncbi:P-loop containing nucleoside triphosphate hydrolase protein, partial [Lojkania enalia]